MPLKLHYIFSCPHDKTYVSHAFILSFNFLLFVYMCGSTNEKYLKPDFYGTCTPTFKNLLKPQRGCIKLLLFNVNNYVTLTSKLF